MLSCRFHAKGPSRVTCTTSSDPRAPHNDPQVVIPSPGTHSATLERKRARFGEPEQTRDRGGARPWGRRRLPTAAPASPRPNPPASIYYCVHLLRPSTTSVHLIRPCITSVHLLLEADLGEDVGCPPPHLHHLVRLHQSPSTFFSAASIYNITASIYNIPASIYTIKASMYNIWE